MSHKLITLKTQNKPKIGSIFYISIFSCQPFHMDVLSVIRWFKLINQDGNS